MAVFSPRKRTTTYPSPSINRTLLIAFLAILSLSTSSPSPETTPKTITYDEHCSSLVPQPNATALQASFDIMHLSNDYFSGGNSLFNPYDESKWSSNRLYAFNARRFFETDSTDILMVEGTLVVRGEPRVEVLYSYNSSWDYRFRKRASTVRVHFELSGFWSKSKGIVCMVGTSNSLSVVLKFSYPNSANISNSFVSGTLESCDSVESPNHFDSIVLAAFVERNYKYTMISEASEAGSGLEIGDEPLRSNIEASCSYFRSQLSGQFFRLEYGSVGGPVGFSPKFMLLTVLGCSEDGKLRLHIGFFSGLNRYRFKVASVAEVSFIAEGHWDHKKSVLHAMACRLHGDMLLQNAVACDGSIELSLWFRAVLSVRKMGLVGGRIRSTDGSTVSFSSIYAVYSPSVKYEYTELNAVEKSCEFVTTTGFDNLSFPTSMWNMAVTMSLVDREGSTGCGTAMVVSIGERYYGEASARMVIAKELMKPPKGEMWNVSYKLSYNWDDHNETTDVWAEGIYDTRTGRLCMIGCHRLEHSMDCDIRIDFQLPPINAGANGGFAGKIRSIRSVTNPLYFKYSVEVSAYHCENDFRSTVSAETRRSGPKTDIDTGIVLMLSFAIFGLWFVCRMCVEYL